MAPAKEQTDMEDDIIKDTSMPKAEKAKGSQSAALDAASSSAALSRSGNFKASAQKGDSNSSVVLTRAEVPKGPVFLETLDGDVEEVEREVALLSPLVLREVIHFGHGASRASPVALPKQVNIGVLKLILDYCRFHRVPGRSDKERKFFDEKFIRLDTGKLCELLSAANSLDMKPLVDLSSKAIARMIKGKTPEEIRETFHLPDDLTEEEKLEPVKHAADDPRIRLLNRLYAKKRKELQEKKLLKNASSPGPDDKPQDDRSVDDLLSFIDGSGSDGKTGKAGKAKKKKKDKKKEPSKEYGEGEDPVHIQGDAPGSKEADAGEMANQQMAQLWGDHVPSDSPIDKNVHFVTGKINGHDFVPASASGSGRQKEIFEETEFDEDDGIDPAMREKLDREVEDFARRLNVDWEDRKEEILATASGRDQEDAHSDEPYWNLPSSSAGLEGNGHRIEEPWEINEEKKTIVAQQSSEEEGDTEASTSFGRRGLGEAEGTAGIAATAVEATLEEEPLEADDLSESLARALVEGLPSWTPSSTVTPLSVDGGQRLQKGPRLFSLSPPPLPPLLPRPPALPPLSLSIPAVPVPVPHPHPSRPLLPETILAESLAGRRDVLGQLLKTEIDTAWPRGNANNTWDVSDLVNGQVRSPGISVGDVVAVSSPSYCGNVMQSPSINGLPAVQNGHRIPSGPSVRGLSHQSSQSLQSGQNGLIAGSWMAASTHENNDISQPTSVESSAGSSAGGSGNLWMADSGRSEVLDGQWGSPVALTLRPAVGTNAGAYEPAELAGFLKSLIQLLDLDSQVEIVWKGSLVQRSNVSSVSGQSTTIDPEAALPRVALVPEIQEEGGLQVSHRLSSGAFVSVSLSGFHQFRCHPSLEKSSSLQGT